MHAVMSVVHLDWLAGFAAAIANADISALIPAARHDCSIKLSYASDAFSAVQPSTRAIHWRIAHAYRADGASGAFCNSLADKLYFADVPTDTLRIVLVGVPASAVPQYWQRAAGLDDTLIAHTESKHRVKSATLHAACAIFACTAPSAIATEKI